MLVDLLYFVSQEWLMKCNKFFSGEVIQYYKAFGSFCLKYSVAIAVAKITKNLLLKYYMQNIFRLQM